MCGYETAKFERQTKSERGPALLLNGLPRYMYIDLGTLASLDLLCLHERQRVDLSDQALYLCGRGWCSLQFVTSHAFKRLLTRIRNLIFSPHAMQVY